MADVKIFKEYNELESIKGAWDSLARQTADPNVFYESILLLPAWKHLEKPAGLSLFTLWEDSRLIALFPFGEFSRFNGLPFKHLSNWQYIHCYLGTPLVRAGHEDLFAKSVSSWFQSSHYSSRTFKWSQLNADGPTYQAIEKSATDSAAGRRVESTQRAYFKKLDNYEEHLQAMISGKHRRDFLRRRRRLAESGELTYQHNDHSKNLAIWLEEFMEVEGSGWKGREGTAIKCSENDRSFLRDACSRAMESDCLFTSSSRLDGKMISATLDFKRGPGLFYFKVAFDEKYARQSPGILLELDHLKWIYENSQIEWADSCTAPENEILNRFWLQKRNISTMAIAYRAFPDRSFIEYVLPAMKKVKTKLTSQNQKEKV